MRQTSCRRDIAGGISPHYQNRSVFFCVFSHQVTSLDAARVKSLRRHLNSERCGGSVQSGSYLRKLGR